MNRRGNGKNACFQILRKLIEPFRWNRFRLLCDQHKYLGVVLELTSNLPGTSHQARWLAEPVQGVFVRTSLFLTNRHNFPVLSSAHNKYLREFATIGAHPILCGSSSKMDLTNFANYLVYILVTFKVNLVVISHFIMSSGRKMPTKLLKAMTLLTKHSRIKYKIPCSR